MLKYLMIERTKVGNYYKLVYLGKDIQTFCILILLTFVSVKLF